MSEPTVVVPGQDLGPVSSWLPGSGTHIHSSRVFASVLGLAHKTTPPKPVGPQKRLTKITPQAPIILPTISVRSSSLVSSDSQAISGSIAKAQAIPEVGGTVLCKVTRITPRQATVAILVAGETVLDGEWQGLIRVQDVRATEKDRVKIFESFRPGDVVRAVVISLGDQSNYYLSTASNNLGVIMAMSEAGNPMYPVSWKEYKDPETGESESRKVAKPF